MKFLKVFTCLMILTNLGFAYPEKIHIETVANLAIEHAKDGLTITVSLEKRHLTYAMKKEAKCLPQDMLRVCANQYVQEHLAFIVNDKNVKIRQVSQELTKTSLVITYQLEFQEPIKKITINSDYMMKYNDHSKVSILSKLTADNQTYSLSAKRKQITISL